jgi:hypothetical protein
MAEAIDFQLMVGRLRPSSEFQWKGNGLGRYEDIGEWRDRNTTKPTLPEIEAEWSRYLAERQAEENRQTKLSQARQSYGAAELDLTAFSGQPALVQQLAQKIVLLEREIADLRRGG